jgi:hypothetical protein
MFITSVNDTGDKLLISCSSVSLTPAINSCHGFSVIAGVVDKGDNLLFYLGVWIEKCLDRAPASKKGGDLNYSTHQYIFINNTYIMGVFSSVLCNTQVRL